MYNPRSFQQPKSTFKCPCDTRSHSDNNSMFAEGCPALMSDGRFLTWHGSTRELTEEIRRRNGIRNPNKLREFMQDNAEKFIQADRSNAMNRSMCSPQTACSEGWRKLWEDCNGNWANYQPDYRRFD